MTVLERFFLWLAGLMGVALEDIEMEDESD